MVSRSVERPVTNRSHTTPVGNRCHRITPLTPDHSDTGRLPQPAPPRRALRRLVGATTATFVGIGVAVGSGIFRTPGEVAALIASTWIMLGLWIAAGGITLLQSLVTAELATRLPDAGGEYQYLKAAYGEFAAFFFGWSFTVFILGGGVATIALATGDLSAELLGLGDPWPRLLACGAIVAVTAVNAVGLTAGAWTQNALTAVKVLALLGITAGAFWIGGRAWPAPPTPPAALSSATAGAQLSLSVVLTAAQSIFWSYSGATESAKLAEEMHDVRRGLPLALCGAALSVTVVYTLFNYALVCAAPIGSLAGAPSAAGIIFERAGWASARHVSLGLSALICLGCLSSTILSDVRVPFALARDGLAPAALGRMSRRQSPVAALLVAAAIAIAFVTRRSFTAMLDIYILASTVLFGMSYASLIVLRRREGRRGEPPSDRVFLAPGGVVLAGGLVLLEAAIAGNVIVNDVSSGKYDTPWTLALLAGVATLYGLWKRLYPRTGGSPGSRGA